MNINRYLGSDKAPGELHKTGSIVDQISITIKHWTNSLWFACASTSAESCPPTRSEPVAAPPPMSLLMLIVAMRTRSKENASWAARDEMPKLSTSGTWSKWQAQDDTCMNAYASSISEAWLPCATHDLQALAYDLKINN